MPAAGLSKGRVRGSRAFQLTMVNFEYLINFGGLTMKWYLAAVFTLGLVASTLVYSSAAYAGSGECSGGQCKCAECKECKQGKECSEECAKKCSCEKCKDHKNCSCGKKKGDGPAGEGKAKKAKNGKKNAETK